MVAESLELSGIAEGGEGTIGGDAFFSLGNKVCGEIGGKLPFVVTAFGKGEDVGTEDEVGGAGVFFTLEFFH